MHFALSVFSQVTQLETCHELTLKNTCLKKFFELIVDLIKNEYSIVGPPTGVLIVS